MIDLYWLLPLLVFTVTFVVCLDWGLVKWRWQQRKSKPEPKPAWDGKHELRGVKHIEHFGNRPDDYSTGWLWECTCGVNNQHEIGFRLPMRESLAVFEWIAHRDLYAGMDQSFGG